MNKPAAIKDVSVFAPETLLDPFDYYRAIHDAGITIEHLPEMNTYVVYSYDLCSEVNTKPEIFSNDFSVLMGREADEASDVGSGGGAGRRAGSSNGSRGGSPSVAGGSPSWRRRRCRHMMKMPPTIT